MNYKKWSLLILIIGFIYWGNYLLWYWEGAFYYQNYGVLLMMIITLAGFIAFVQGIIKHNKIYEPFIPLVIAIFMIMPVPSLFADNIRNIKFNQNYSQYEEIAKKAEGLPVGEIQNLPSNYPAYSVIVYSYENGKTIKFITGRGRVNWGYYFVKDDSEDNLRRLFKVYRFKHIKYQWYFFAD